MLVTVIIPCRNEARHLGSCLESILATTYPHDRLEVLIVDGASTDDTRDIAARYAARHAWIHLVDNPRRIVPAALNLGVERARGDVIVRMDAHGVYPPNYLPRLVAALLETGADNVGGCLRTVPGGPGPVARAIAIALSHPLGVGNSLFRVGTRARCFTDTVPFGCFRRDVFTRFGRFDEELVRNQDDEFNHRIIRRGGRVLLDPAIVAHYYARQTLGQLARMYYQYGLFKPLVARKLGTVMTARQLAPPLLVFGLAAAALLLPFTALAWPFLGAVALAWLGPLVLASVPAAVRHGPRTALALVAAFATIHMSYGTGFHHGLLRLLRPAPRGGDPAALPLSR